MQIVRIAASNIGFDRAPVTLRSHLVSNASQFEDFHDREAGWFGEVVFTLVEVEASDGTVGYGTAGGFQGAAKALIADYYAGLVLGEDPRRHEHLWQRMYRTTVRFGRSGAAMAAIAAIDNACWDLHAKSLAVPVYELIGGRCQISVPCYASRLYALEDLDELAREAREWVSSGFQSLKQRFGFGPADGPDGMRRNVELVRTVRDAIGPDVELAADAYMGWDVGYAMQMADRLRDYDLAWIEEPLMPHEFDGYAELKHRCPWQRWSTGEHLYSKWEFKQLIDRRAADILQPDANRSGGITETLKICAMAEAAGLPVIPHSNEAHNLAIVFSRPAHVCPKVEYFPPVEPDTGNELFWKIFAGLPAAERGRIAPAEAPGLGIAVCRSAVERLEAGHTAQFHLAREMQP
jgi:L-rhamnonate dehydratase